ncbi:MAG: fructose-bisphosphate aldolase, partial [Flavisolibacter sp.]|nr:fructose-bisphosphate aldolase [Flavisolibacter sp.]
MLTQEIPAKSITDLLGEKAEYLLNHTCQTIPKEDLHLPSPDH